jgi:cupin-like protein
MNMPVRRSITMDWDNFHPAHTQGLVHDFADHPLLAPDELAQLGKRCRGTSRWFSFNSNARPDSNFDEVGRLFPNNRSIVDSIHDISNARAWVLLRHIQADPAYRTLVDEAMDSVRERIETNDPGMYYRAGWIFVASPRTVTPYHIDRNNGLLLQVRGHKTLYVWDPDDEYVCSAHARETFHARHDLSLVRWREEFRERAHRYDLAPGTGAYIPMTSPHMVETLDESSITVSFTYSTHATRRESMMHFAHELARRARVTLPPLGSAPLSDRAAYALTALSVAAHGPGSRPPACPSLAHRTPYAVAD